MERLALRAAIRVAAFLAAVLVFIGGLGFLVLAAYLALLVHLSPPIAALVAAGIAFLLAALIIVAGGIIVAQMRRQQRHDADQLVKAFRDLLGDEIVTLATQNPHATLFTSLATGFAIGAIPELRDLLRDLLRKA